MHESQQSGLQIRVAAVLALLDELFQAIAGQQVQPVLDLQAECAARPQHQRAQLESSSADDVSDTHLLGELEDGLVYVVG